ncbi:hypothetical protein BD560DRAFT_332413 [Blakeslea trispora]|nr:hypothetical protein BD560DRAFT_332413 [Blakeslea trispora]
MELECYEDDTVYYKQEIPYTEKLQKLIDSASATQLPVVYLEPGLFIIDSDKPIVLKKGVSLKGHPSQPTIFATKDKNTTATIQVEKENQGWTIQDIMFENINIRTVDNTHEDESAIFGNVFMNGGSSSILSDNGKRLYIDSNIFLRDEAHATLKSQSPTPDVGVILHAQRNSLVSNNIFGMDLRKIDNYDNVVDIKLEKPLKNLKFVYQCLNRNLGDQQGYLSSGVQVSEASDITINQNIMNTTLSDTLVQNHAILVSKSNQTFVYQNFFAGGQMNELGGAVQFASTVDGYFISNYMSNTGLVMSVLNETTGSELNNMVVYNNFFYRFMDQESSEDFKGLRYDGISYLDLHSSLKALSSYGWHMVISSNRFGATQGVDPSFISIGNIESKEGFVDRRNCYVTEPLVPGSSDAFIVPVLWRQSFEEGIFTKNRGKIPKKLFQYTKNDLYDQIPSHLRFLPVLKYWKAFTLQHDTVAMVDPTLPCKIA